MIGDRVKVTLGWVRFCYGWLGRVKIFRAFRQGEGLCGLGLGVQLGLGLGLAINENNSGRRRGIPMVEVPGPKGWRGARGTFLKWPLKIFALYGILSSPPGKPKMRNISKLLHFEPASPNTF